MGDNSEQAGSTLAQDWITICQSELAAWADDPEMQETVRGWAALWTSSALPIAAILDEQTQRTRADAQARPPAARAASGAGKQDRDSLARRVAELERRVAALDGG